MKIPNLGHIITTEQVSGLWVKISFVKPSKIILIVGKHDK